MAENSPYPLNEADKNGIEQESKRLDYQHHFFDDVMNNELLPQHATNMLAHTPSPRVCDVATGTAIWLKELSKILPATAELVGFDFDVSKFPKPEALPSNVRLSFGDVYEPFPEKFQNYFDVVHLRHFNLAMKRGQGVSLIRNLSSLLRPGGFLVWAEASAPLASAEPPSDGLFQAQKVYCNFLDSANLEANFPLGIVSSMEQAGLVDCEARSYHCASVLFGPKASNWLARQHEEFYATLGQIMKGVFLKGGVDGLRTQRELDELLGKLRDDMTGTRKYHMPVIRTWGRKVSDT